LQVLAKSKGSTVAQLLLAWLLTQQDYIVSIPGSRNARRAEENVAPLTSHSAPTISPESNGSHSNTT
jgi:aryl-alcohol dehydrogenase-like predicted oxidoreductase